MPEALERLEIELNALEDKPYASITFNILKIYSTSKQVMRDTKCTLHFLLIILASEPYADLPFSNILVNPLSGSKAKLKKLKDIYFDKFYATNTIRAATFTDMKLRIELDINIEFNQEESLYCSYSTIFQSIITKIQKALSIDFTENVPRLFDYPIQEILGVVNAEEWYKHGIFWINELEPILKKIVSTYEEKGFLFPPSLQLLFDVESLLYCCFSGDLSKLSENLSRLDVGNNLLQFGRPILPDSIFKWSQLSVDLTLRKPYNTKDLLFSQWTVKPLAYKNLHFHDETIKVTALDYMWGLYTNLDMLLLDKLGKESWTQWIYDFFFFLLREVHYRLKDHGSVFLAMENNNEELMQIYNNSRSELRKPLLFDSKVLLTASIVEAFQDTPTTIRKEVNAKHLINHLLALDTGTSTDENVFRTGILHYSSYFKIKKLTLK